LEKGSIISGQIGTSGGVRAHHLIEACMANERRATNGSPDPREFTSKLPNIIDDCIANDRFAKPFCFVARPLRWSASIVGYARLINCAGINNGRLLTGI
jgi:hypothetical protein